MLPSFGILRPDSVADAVGLIDEGSVPYWGGTELLLAMKMGLLRPDALVDLKRVSELTGIRRQDDLLVLGAGTTHDQLATDPLVAGLVPLLARVEQQVGNARVRAQGTIGGNLCFAEPRSDVATALIAVAAEVRLTGPGGTRTLPVRDFVLGPYWTAREPDEVLVDIRIPLPAPAGIYLKYQTVERPTVAVAAVGPIDGGYRLVIGAVTELPMMISLQSLDELDAAQLCATIEPMVDLTGSPRYKRHVTQVYLERAVLALSGANNV